MKIAQVAPFYYPRRGGVETVVKEYSERLVRRGHQVHVYPTDGSAQSPWVEEINGVKVHRSIRVPLPVLTPLSPAFLFPSKLWRSDVDLIHVHANKYFSTDAGSLIAKLRGLPLVYSPHAGTFGKSLFGRIYNQTIGRIALSADVVVCVSNYEKNLIQASGVPVNKFEILPNGVDIKRYETGEPADFTKLGLLSQPSFSKTQCPANQQETSPAVLYLGRLSSHKGLDTLIGAAPLVLEKVPKVRFIIAGPGGNSNFKSQISNLKLEDRFIFLGEALDEEKISLMQKADVFVLPSRSEAFGITVIEAMAAGCPVIVSDIPALTEIVEDDKTGFVFPVDDEKALSNQIVRLLSNQDLSHQISENAKKFVKEKYDWENIIDRLEKIYREILR